MPEKHVSGLLVAKTRIEFCYQALGLFITTKEITLKQLNVVEKCNVVAQVICKAEGATS